MLKKLIYPLLWCSLAGLLLAGCTRTPIVQREKTLAISPALPLPVTATLTPTLTVTRSTQSLTGASSSTPTFSPTPLLSSPLAPPTLHPTALAEQATAPPPPSPTPIPSSTPLPPPPPVPVPPTLMATTPLQPESRTLRIGLHGRNDLDFQEVDYQLVREAGIETLKMISLTRPEVFARLRQENPSLEFIVRLYDDRINAEGHPSPPEFASRMIPVMQSLQPYAVKFEISNEPNHFRRYEGWGPEAADAEDFNQWFLEVYDLLKTAHPWAQLGFPALGTPDSVHHDRLWLELNRAAIEQADWLGVHCYWQTYPDGSTTMFDPAHGLCFTYYHELFPDKPLELTEFDNDNIIWDIPPLSEEALASEITTYYQVLFAYPYLHSASSFIMSSPDPRWDYFTWRSESNEFKPVVAAVAGMPRLPLAE